MSRAEIEYSSRAAKQLEKLDPPIAERIVSKLEDVAWNPEHYLKRRKVKSSSYYSLRVGDYRAIIDWRKGDTPELLFVRRVDHRGNVYA